MRPKINIKYGKLIDLFLKEYVNVHYPGYKFPTESDVFVKVNLFKQAWFKRENVFVDFLNNTLGLNFKRNIIDCFVVSAIPRDMSSPLLIRSRWSGEEFVDVLMHELIHILFSDNKTKKIVIDEVGLSQRTINHIMVFAVLKKFYLEILKDEKRLKKVMEKSTSPNNQEYLKAWNLVEKIGYQEVIDIIKNTV